MRMAGAIAAAAALAAAAPVPAGAQDLVLDPARDAIQPGMFVAVAGSECTGNFVFDGVGGLSGRHFIGTAAHCTESRIGAVAADAQGREFGRVAFSAWPYDSYADDYAFIEIDPSAYPRVDPSLAGHPQIPTGLLAAGHGAAGDRVQLSGWGFATAAKTETREQRISFLKSHNDRFWFAEAVASNSDSGGPVVHLPTGGAMGSVSSFCAPFPVDHSEGWEPGCTAWGPSMAGIVAAAAARGFTVEVRTAAEGPPTVPPPPPPPSPPPAAGTAPSRSEPAPRRRSKPKKARRGRRSCTRGRKGSTRKARRRCRGRRG